MRLEERRSEVGCQLSITKLEEHDWEAAMELVEILSKGEGSCQLKAMNVSTYYCKRDVIDDGV